MTDNELYDKIKILSKTQNLKIRDLAEKVDMTEAGFYKSFKNNSLKVETLQKIADVLAVDIREFFGGIGVDNTELEKEHEKLKEEDTKNSFLIVVLKYSLLDMLQIIADTFEYSRKKLSDRDVKRYENLIKKAKEIIDSGIM